MGGTWLCYVVFSILWDDAIPQSLAHLNAALWSLSRDTWLAFDFETPGPAAPSELPWVPPKSPWSQNAVAGVCWRRQPRIRSGYEVFREV